MLSWYRCFTATRLPGVIITHHLIFLCCKMYLKWDCSNPTGSVDWYSTSSIWLAESFYLFSLCLILTCTLPLPSPSPSPPNNASMLCKASHLCSFIFLLDVCILHGIWCLTLRREESNHQSQHTYLQILHGWQLLTNNSTGSYWLTVATAFPNFCMKLESSLQ